MGKGRYLKAAERACARKARFETAVAAEAFAERRYRSYRCVVCGGYHLTSGRGDRERTPVPPTPKKEAGPTLGDLDWSAVLDPKPPATTPCPSSRSRSGEAENGSEAPQRQEEEGRRARVAAPCGKDGRALLVLDGRLVKSAKVAQALRPRVKVGVEVTVDERLAVLGVEGELRR